jgi:hypothetical protein
MLSGSGARDAEALANAVWSPAALGPLAAHGAAVVFCERQGRPLPAVIRLDPPCLEGVFVDEDEFHRSPPEGDLILVSRWGDVQMWAGGEVVEDAPPLASLAIERVGGFSTGPVLRLRWIGPPPTDAASLLATIESVDDAYGAWWQDWDARGRP